MKRSLVLLCLMPFLSFQVRAEEAAKVSPAKQDERGFLVHTVESQYQAGETKIRVLLPERMETGERLPILFVLPVERLDENRYGDGLLEVKKLDLHNKYGLICVQPSFSHLPWYADHPSDDGIRQESHMLKVVVPFVDRGYPTLGRRQGRLLLGFSKSGWGAFSLLLRRPDLFDKAVAWDAPLMMERPNKFGMAGVFETQENFEKYQLSTLLRRRTAILKDGARLAHFGYDNFRQHHRAAHRLMNELGINHPYSDGPKRAHTWHGGWLPDALRLLLGEPKGD